MTDDHWAHLHHHSPDATSVTVAVESISHVATDTFLDYASLPIQIRYTVHGVPVSGWLTTFPYPFTLDFTNPALGSVADGIHDLSVEVQGPPGPGTAGGRPIAPVRQDFKPYPMFLHIGGRSTPSPLVPVLAQSPDYRVEMANADGNYVNASTLVPKGYPADPDVGSGWSGAPPYIQDLYQEPMQPHAREFSSVQMLWEEPPGTISAGLRFIRALTPKAGNSYTRLWDNGGQVDPDQFGFSGHRSFPVKDGPRGIGWTNGYCQGVVDKDGVLWMVNVSGQLRIMKPDGELITLVGWRVKPDKQPVWYLKPLKSIRMNMEFRGSFTSGGWPDVIDPGWHQPMDVALDPNNANRVYVAAFYDNAVYQVDVNRATWTGTVSTLAGDVNHQPGYVNAIGDQARFWHPVSLVASNDGTKLYVTDHDNDSIRAINLSTHAVTTVFGGPTTGAKLKAAGVNCVNDDATGSPAGRLACFPPSQVKPHLHITVSPSEAASGVRPDVYYPFWMRITSTNELVLFDRALNTIRKLNPTTGVTTLVDDIGDAGFSASEFGRGWVWGDVDKTGHAGLVDGIYWGTDVSASMPSQETKDRFNEEYRFTSIDGSVRKFVFARSFLGDPEDLGPVSRTLPPHYPWLMAVDPRGAVIFGGIGDHGLTRLRVRRATDPDIPDDLVHYDARQVWQSGAPSPLGSYYSFAPNGTNSIVNAPALIYGYGGHNMIGEPDAWAITPTTTDSQIDALFALPSSITSNAGAHAAVLAFLRANSGSGSSDAPPPYISYSSPVTTTVTSTCATPDPFATMGGGTCYNGGWLPPGMAPPNTTPSTGSGGSSSAGTSTGSSCASPDPFVSMGGGTCWYGGWLPPAMTPPTAGTPSGSSSPSPGSSGSTSPGGTSGGSTGAPCTTRDPFATMGGGTCYNGGWLPPGMTPPTGSTSPTPPSSPTPGGCLTPDPFITLPGLIGMCVNGGWIPIIRSSGGDDHFNMR